MLVYNSICCCKTSAVDPDTVYQYQVYVCESDYHLYHLVSIYVIEGLLLLFGTFLAWETRKVKLPLAIFVSGESIM